MERQLLFSRRRISIVPMQRLGTSASLGQAQAQSQTQHPKSGARPEPAKCHHPIHGCAACWSVVVANEVPDPASGNQAHRTPEGTIRVELAGVSMERRKDPAKRMR